MKYIFEIKIKDRHTEKEYIDAWKKGSEIIQKSDGAEGTILYKKIDEPNRLLAIATWESKEKRDTAMKRLSLENSEVQKILNKHDEFALRNSLGNFEEITRIESNISKNNYAFIDGQNLYLAIQELGWKLDYKRFRTYLKEKYQIEKAYMFMGFIPTNKDLYDFLESVGFKLIFKPVLENKDYNIKGNCDAELVMQSIIDMRNYHQAMLVTGDGDFHCLIKYLNTENKLLKVLAPSIKNCSSLVKKAAKKRISLVSDLRDKLEYKKKRTP